MSSGEYFASRAVAGGLSDRDGRYSFCVVSVLYSGLGLALFLLLLWLVVVFLKFLVGKGWVISGILGYKGALRGVGKDRFWTVPPLICLSRIMGVFKISFAPLLLDCGCDFQ